MKRQITYAGPKNNNNCNKSNYENKLIHVYKYIMASAKCQQMTPPEILCDRKQKLKEKWKGAGIEKVSHK